MSKARSTGNLNNSILISDTGAITFVSGSTTLASLSTTGQLSGSAPVLFAATSSFANTFTVAGTLTAQTLVVQTITSSVSQITGSTKFGIIDSNTHQFTGSMYVTGAFYVSSGSVGIRTTTPSSILSIYGTGNMTSQQDFFSNTSDIKGHIGQFSNNLYITNNWYYNGSQNADSQSYAQTAMILDGTGFISLNTSAVGTLAPTERMRITSGGNVGIGTTNPSDKLTINGSVSSNSSIAGLSFTVNNNVSIRAQNISSIGGTYTTIGYSQTYGNLFWVRWNDSGGTTDYALVGCIWYPSTCNVIASTNNGGHGVTFQMSGQYLQMRCASGTVGPVISYQIGD